MRQILNINQNSIIFNSGITPHWDEKGSTTPYTEVFNSDGTEDGNTQENDCTLRYWIQVVEV